MSGILFPCLDNMEDDKSWKEEASSSEDEPMEAVVFKPGWSFSVKIALAGKDMCACSATGTGKTAAFMLPIFERLLFRPKARRSVTRVLVLVPTRELAIQVFQVSRKLSQFSHVDICLCAGR
ncbi:DEAD/DEAH box helicase domain-containing protein [Ditylenchus destructor]|nr:DEAD/DEAH box helicase domain-containing protein [Ditylenchus destructor]